MAQVSQKIGNLLGGVSQQDERTRKDNQGEVQTNGLSDAAAGLRKRPPSRHVAELDSTPANFDDGAYLYPLNRDLDDKFAIIIRNGDLKAYHLRTGLEATVSFPDGKGYLSGIDFRSVSVEDSTYITNQNVSTARAGTKTAARVPEALIYVRQGNEGTNYKVYLDTFQASYTTQVSSTSDSAPDTTDIAQSLLVALNNVSGFTDEFTVTRYGSALYVVRIDGSNFEIRTEDGLSDRGLLAIKGSAQNFSDLPSQAPDGFVVEITGEPGTEFDNYWLTFQAADAVEGEEGVWVETLKPNSLSSFDASTMPHELVLRGALAEDLVNEGGPLTPSVAPGSATSVDEEWDEKNDVAVTSGTQPVLSSHNDKVEMNFPAGTVGLATTLTVRFTGFTTVDFGVPNITLSLYRYDSAHALQETLAAKTYEVTAFDTDHEITDVTTPASGDYLRVVLTYDTGVTPTNPVEARMGWLPDDPGIVLEYSVQKVIDFRAEQLYPGGFDVTVTLAGATNFVHTVTNGDQNGTALAAAFQALIDADSGYSASVSGAQVTIQNTAQTTFTVSFTFEFDEDVDIWIPGADFSAAALTGTNVNNLTDGSTAAVVSWNITTITTSGLSGGTDNTFAKGDLIEVADTGLYFVFKQVEWLDRDVGDDTTNPFPDFIGRPITDVTFYQGRLGFLYADRVFYSAAGALTKLFRYSARQLRNDDPIGAESALPQIASFSDAFTWNKSQYVRAENGIVLVSGDPVLTPSSIRLDLAAEVDSSKDALPAVVGQSLFIGRPRLQRNTPTTIGSYGVQVLELRQVETDVLSQVDITRHIPTYIPGRPKTLVGSSALGILVVLPTDCSLNELYVYSYLDQDRDRVMASWSQWVFSPAAEILNIALISGGLYLVVRYPDGVYLETIDLDEAV